MEARHIVRTALRCSTAAPTTLLGRLFFGAAATATATPRLFSTTSARCKNDLPPPPPPLPSASNKTGRTASWPPQRPSREAAVPGAAPKKNALGSMYSSDNPTSWATWSSDDFYKRHMAAKPRGPQMKLRPSTGRTVHVSGNVDTARAFVMVNVLCRRNGVASDFYRQRFHERPGLKRKRLRSERWRRRFRDSFKATVQRVSELAKQGW